MKPVVYIETTIPCFYYEVRTDPESQARRQWTRRWWDNRRDDYELCTSDAVIDELERGEYPIRDEALSLVRNLTMLEVNEAVVDTVEAYLAHHLMPSDPAGDALHLALASNYKCDFLLTWNCRHLANANKFAHIRKVNGVLGLFVPALVTPLELLGEDSDP